MEPQRGTEEHPQAVWIIDPTHTTVQFSIKYLVFFTVKGCFAEIAGKIVLDETDIRRSAVEASIKAARVDTGNNRRDVRLRSADFLDVAQYPDIRFQSTSVEKGRDRDTLRITGRLTIRASSLEVVLDVIQVDRSRSPRGEEVAYYTVLTQLDRFDYGIDYLRRLIGRTLTITIQVQTVRQN